VTVGPSAIVTRTAKSSVSGLQIGDTVVITGSAGSGGDISATAVRATAPGATAGGTGAGFSGPGGG
jgi:tripartite-type tricarboxylate transporter receptor subunit TctC